MTPSRGRGVPKARRTQPSRIAVHAHIQDTSRRLWRRSVLVPDEGGVLAVRRPKSRGRTPGTRTKLGEAERRFWRGGRLRRPQQAAFMRWVLLLAIAAAASPAGAAVQVAPFTVSKSDEALAYFGAEVGRAVANALERSAAGASSSGDLVVSGRIEQLDAGQVRLSSSVA